MHGGIVTCVLFICLAAIATCDDHGDNAVSFTKETFDAAVSTEKLFVMFFAPWCGHCKRLAPTWDDLGKEYNVAGSKVKIGKVDCTVETGLCGEHGVRGYPTVKFFDLNTEGNKYAGKRAIEDLRSYVEEQLAGGAEKPAETAEVKKDVVPPVETEGLYVLTDDNFEGHIAKGHHFIKFYAPWCGHCKRLAPIWDELAATMKSSDKVKIAKVDCTTSQQTCSKMGVRGYPTLMWFTNGEKGEDYKSQRTIEEFTKFIERLSDTKPEPAKLSKDGMVPDTLLDDSETGVVPLTDEDFVESVSEDFTFAAFGEEQAINALLPTLKALAEEYVDLPEMLVATVNCQENKATCKNQDANGPYPQFKLYFNGAVIDSYKGERTVVAMEKFITSNIEKYGNHDEL